MRLTVRRAELSECEPYVIATWMRREQRCTAYAYHARRERIGRILALRPGLVIATPPEEPAHIIGWALGDSHCLDYVYVRAPYRRLGIASALYAELGSPAWHSHITRLGGLFARKHGIAPLEHTPKERSA